MPVCDARVSSDVFESAQIIPRVDSLWLESAHNFVHTLCLLIESARIPSSWLERPVTDFGHSGRVGSSLFESARTACYWFWSFWSSRLFTLRVGSNDLLFWTTEACHDRVGSSTYVQKRLSTTRFSSQTLLYMLHWLYDLFPSYVIEVTQMFLLYLSRVLL